MKIRPSTTPLWFSVMARFRSILGAPPLVLCLLVLSSAVTSRALAAPPEKTGVTNVMIAGDKERSVVTIKTNKRPTYSVRVADKGNQIVVELSGAVIKGAPAAILDGTELVSGVLTQTFEGTTTRVMIRLANQASYAVSASDEGLTIALTPSQKTTAATAKPAPAEAAKVEAPTLRDVRFEHRTGKDVVTIELSRGVKYDTKSTDGTSRLELKGVGVSSKLERTLDVAAFRGAVRSVSTFKKDDMLVIEVDRVAEAKSFVSDENGIITWTFTTGELSSSETGKGADGGAARRSRTISREEVPEDLPKIETRYVDDPLVREVEPERADAFLPSMAGQVATPGATTADAAADGKQVRAQGRRIDLDLKDADIHDVLRLIADVGRVNIVTADNVTGSVTIRLRNVPWDQALETVLQAKGLGMVRRGNMIRVATLADLNKERELALARRKSEFQLAPLETRLIPISYANAADLMDRAKDLQSPRGSLAVDARTNVIIARDVTGNLNQIEELVRALDTQTPQVLIEARIVEASSRFSRDVGIQWGGDAVMSQGTGNDTGIAFPNSIGLAGGARGQQNIDEGFRGANPNYVVNLPAAVGPGSGGALSMLFGSVDGNFNLGVRLSAAESSGLIRIVSSPRILTLDNKTARISTGTLIPYSQIGAQGVQTSFQEAKLQLLVTPHVTADGSVSMQVKVNRDTPDFGQTGPRGEPTIRKREAETELLVQDGHTAVIGGIYQRNMSRGVDQVPLLGDIPILGFIFQHRTATDDREELVIFITPRIVNRAESLGR